MTQSPPPQDSLGRAARDARELVGALAGLGRSVLEGKPIDQAVESLKTAGAAASLLSSPEIERTLREVDRLANRVRREGVDPARGAANLIGDCLDGLSVLVSTGAIPIPELEELRSIAARLRRPQIAVKIEMPARLSRAPLVGRMIRDLVADSETAMRPESLDSLQRAISEATRGVMMASLVRDASRQIEVGARLWGEELVIEIVAAGSDEVVAGSNRAVEVIADRSWDLALVRREMDEIYYESGERQSRLSLAKRLAIW